MFEQTYTIWKIPIFANSTAYFPVLDWVTITYPRLRNGPFRGVTQGHFLKRAVKTTQHYATNVSKLYSIAIKFTMITHSPAGFHHEQERGFGCFSMDCFKCRSLASHLSITISFIFFPSDCKKDVFGQRYPILSSPATFLEIYHFKICHNLKLFSALPLVP